MTVFYKGKINVYYVYFFSFRPIKMPKLAEYNFVNGMSKIDGKWNSSTLSNTNCKTTINSFLGQTFFHKKYHIQKMYYKSIKFF